MDVEGARVGVELRRPDRRRGRLRARLVVVALAAAQVELRRHRQQLRGLEQTKGYVGHVLVEGRVVGLVKSDDGGVDVGGVQ